MKNKHVFLYMFSSVFLTMLMFLSAPVSFAQEGAVQTKGEVILWEESSESSEPPTSSTEPSDSTVPSESVVSSESSQAATVSKPAGKYPSTGELVKSSLTITGIALLLIMLILFFLKKKKEREIGEGS